MRVLDPYFNANYDSQYSSLKNKAKEILAQQDSLQEIVQLVGKESLSEDQKVILDIAELIIEDFLAQNAFSKYVITLLPISAIFANFLAICIGTISCVLLPSLLVSWNVSSYCTMRLKELLQVWVCVKCL